MKVTCATIVEDSYGLILIGHATNQTIWSLPKGCVDTGETFEHCARRELKEETDLDLREHVFEDLGEHPYIIGKRLHLFRAKVPFINIRHLKCNSTFGGNGVAIPEFDAFATVNWDAMRHILFEPQVKILSQFYDI